MHGKEISHGKSQKTHGKENAARQITKNARQRNAHGKEKEKRTAKKISLPCALAKAARQRVE
jgi:hypothetical protein